MQRTNKIQFGFSVKNRENTHRRVLVVLNVLDVLLVLISFDTHVLLVVFSLSFLFFSFSLESRPFQPFEKDPAWDCWPFTGLQHIHAHRPRGCERADWSAPGPGVNQDRDRSGKRPPRHRDSLSPLTTSRHTAPHHTHSPAVTGTWKPWLVSCVFWYKHNLKPCFAWNSLGKNQQMKRIERKENTKRETGIAHFFLISPMVLMVSMNVSLELFFRHVFFLFYRFI